MAEILSMDEIDDLLEIDKTSDTFDSEEIQNVVCDKVKDLENEKRKIDDKIKAVEGLNMLQNTRYFTIKDYTNIIYGLLRCLEYKINCGQTSFDCIHDEAEQEDFMEKLDEFINNLVSFKTSLDE